MIEATLELSEQVGLKPACDALEVSRSAIYRQRTSTSKPAELPESKPQRRPSPRGLSANEKSEVLKTLHSERFVDAAPRTVVATLLGEGVYTCSYRTMYRLLRENDETRERRNQAKHRVYARPELLATAPNQVWSWDGTWLRGPKKGDKYSLYIMLDIFSRYVVGWMLAESENGEDAKHFIQECYESQHVDRRQLILHSDRGSAQRSEEVVRLTTKLGIARSYSRPRVCNDNPFSESVNKTLKYHHEFPERFDSPEHARNFCQDFFDWYNNEHQHSSIAFLPPGIVHTNAEKPILKKRQQTMDSAYAAHPQRFVNGPPAITPLPTHVYLNKPQTQTQAH